jgi:uncharacterized protein
VPRDYKSAVFWLKKSADQGAFSGQYGLAGLYVQGEGVPQDYVMAHMWYNLAVAGVGVGGDMQVDLARPKRDALAAKMTPEQLTEAQRLAREWKAK